MIDPVNPLRRWAVEVGLFRNRLRQDRDFRMTMQRVCHLSQSPDQHYYVSTTLLVPVSFIKQTLEETAAAFEEWRAIIGELQRNEDEHWQRRQQESLKRLGG